MPLGFDTLAVAVALGLRGMRPLRPAITFSVLEAMMPLVGLFLGRFVGARFETPAVVLGGAVLIVVAGFLFKEAYSGDEAGSLSFTSLRTATLAGFGISMDELAVGFPMGTTGLPIVQTILAIGLQAFVVTYVGVRVGARLSTTVGHRTARAATLVAAFAFGLLGTYLIAERFVSRLRAV